MSRRSSSDRLRVKQLRLLKWLDESAWWSRCSDDQAASNDVRSNGTDRRRFGLGSSAAPGFGHDAWLTQPARRRRHRRKENREAREACWPYPFRLVVTSADDEADGLR